jgi:hypothetical protein
MFASMETFETLKVTFVEQKLGRTQFGCVCLCVGWWFSKVKSGMTSVENGECRGCLSMSQNGNEV